MVDTNNDFIQYNLYQKVCDKLKKNNNLENLSAQFGGLKTDEQRVKFVLGLNIINQVVQIQPSFIPKSSSKSNDFRSEGNALFKKKNFQKALEKYNQSILHAPQDDQKTSSLVYANRSAVLFHLREYELCLQDIQTSLEFNYPEELHYKILDRQARCFKLLGNNDKAQTAFNAALESIEKCNLNEKEKTIWRKDLEKKLKNLCLEEKDTVPQIKQLDAIRSGYPALPELPSVNDKYNASSKAFDVTSSPTTGRYPIAAQDINIGEALVIEKPFASVLLEDCESTHCHHCLKRCLAPIPCRQCTNVRYCSVRCEIESWQQYHVYECKYLEHIQKTGKYGHLALRTLLKAGVSVIQGANSLANDFENLGINNDEIYDPSNYRTIYNLVGHTESRTVGDLFRRAVIAAYLLNCVKDTTFFTEEKTEHADSRARDEFAKAGGIILRHLQSFPCNAHEISELQLSLKSVETSVTMEIGAGIYATLSLFNHSCDPSVTRFFYGDTCVVRALKGITAGQEIADNYGVLSALTPRIERRKILASQYYFDCNCQACIQDVPLFSDIALITQPTLWCDSCKSTLPTSHEQCIVCQTCNADQDIALKTKLLERSEQRMKQAVDKLFQGDVANSLPHIQSHLRILEKNVVPPWYGFNSCRELIKQCYNILANCHLVD